MRRMFRSAAAAIIAVAACGCSSVAPQARDSATSDTMQQVPEFSGPWAEMFADTYRRATTDQQRAVLRDGEVTEAEHLELSQAFAECLSGFGYIITFGEGGRFALDVQSQTVPDERVQSVVHECTSSTVGDVDALYEEVRRNPGNLDERDIMAACLVREGVVDSRFTADEYARWFNSEDGERVPFTVDASVGEATFSECNLDPLGLLR